MRNKKIGILGGTFNPIHFGHINLALHMFETQELDAVYVVPARVSPLKTDEHLISKEHRREMVRLAIEPIPSFQLIDWELEREGPSYTIDLVRALKVQQPNDQFFLILGEDSLITLPHWKEVEELLTLAAPLVGARSGLIDTLDSKIKNLCLSGIVAIPRMDISSTLIRARLRQGLYCGHLLPAKVVDYIYECHLYY